MVCVKEDDDVMTLVLIGLFGLLALVGLLCALDSAWRQTDRFAISAILGDDRLVAEDAERSLTADLLSGSITREQYRDAAGSLAAGEPQPAGLQRLVGKG
jgi:hypothetical protein